MPADATDSVVQEAEPDIRSLLESAVEERRTPERGADGKFAKVEAEPGEATEAAVEPVAQPEVADTPTPEAAPPAPDAPANWAPADKETFKAIPPEAREFLLRRHKEMEADYTRKTEQAAASRREYDPVQRLLDPYKPQMAAAGFTPETLIGAWMNVERALTSGQGVSVIKDIVGKYNIDPRVVARELGILQPGNGTQQPAEGAPATPASQLPPEVINLLQGLDQRQRAIETNFTARQQAEQREEQNRLSQTITAFQDARDASGNQVHPHFEQVRFMMGHLMNAASQQGQDLTMEDAYQQAVWANTSTRQQQLDSARAAEQAQQKATQDAAAKEARAKAERAKKAGSSVTGAPGTGQAPINGQVPANESLRDTIRAAMSETANA